MSWNLTDQEYAAVRTLPASARYEYLVKHVADEGQLWSLKGPGGWVLGADERGRELHPVWPHPRYAQAATLGDWGDAHPEPIEVHEWLDVWTAGMKDTRRRVAVFPADEADEAAIEPDDFARDLQQELDKLE